MLTVLVLLAFVDIAATSEGRLFRVLKEKVCVLNSFETTRF